jgi:hypothetical protein
MMPYYTYYTSERNNNSALLYYHLLYALFDSKKDADAEGKAVLMLLNVDVCACAPDSAAYTSKWIEPKQTEPFQDEKRFFLPLFRLRWFDLNFSFYTGHKI